MFSKTFRCLFLIQQTNKRWLPQQYIQLQCPNIRKVLTRDNSRACTRPQNEIFLYKKITTLKSIFKCNDEKAFEIHETFGQFNPDDIAKKVKWLRRRNISLSTILDNFELLHKPQDHIETSYTLLKSMNWKQSDDFLPLVVLSEKEIIRLELLEMHRIRIRVYDLADRFQIEPRIVSKKCANNFFILTIQRDALWKKVQILVDYNVSMTYIIKDLKALAPSEDALRVRLDYLVANDVHRILPWMLRCPENAIKRTIERRHELNPNENRIIDFLAKNLQLHGKSAHSLWKKNQYLSELDLTEAVAVMDLLLNHFGVEQIKKNVRLLTKPLAELEQRIMEAESFGLNNIDPKYLAKSKTTFETYLQSLNDETENKNLRTGDG